jgi:predicted Zn-dependent protease
VALPSSAASDVLAEARVEAQNRHFEKARKILTDAVRDDPTNAELTDALGELNYAFGYYPAAAEAFDKALKLNPGDSSIRAGLAATLLRMGDEDRGVPMTERLLHGTPPTMDLDLALVYVQFLMDRGRTGAALQEAREAADYAPDQPMPHFWIARLLIEKGDFKGAAPEAEKSVELAPGLPNGHNLLIRIYRALGRSGDADREAEWVRQYEVKRARP